MTKTSYKADQRRRKQFGRKIKKRLETIRKKIEAVTTELGELESRDAENCVYCLNNAHSEIFEAEENYTTFLK